jgi:hypothetical protein
LITRYSARLRKESAEQRVIAETSKRIENEGGNSKIVVSGRKDNISII